METIKRTRHHSTFYKLLTTADNLGYISNSTVSAILDLYLVLNLGRSWWPLLLAMVLGIELTKQTCLIRSNTLKAIKSFVDTGKKKGEHLGHNHINRKIRLYGAFFLVFTLLSLVSSLGFSLLLSNKTSKSYDIEKTTIQKNIDSLTESKEAYLAANSRFTELQQNSEDSEKAAKETLRQAEDAYNTAKNKAQDAYTYLSSEYDKKAIEFDGTNNAQFKQWLVDVDYYTVRDIGKGRKESTEISETRIAYERALEDFTDLESGKAITRAKNVAEAAKAEYDAKVALLGTIDELEIRLKQISQEELDAADSTKEFMLIARTFKIDEHTDKLQFFILMVLAIVTEIGIVINSPKIILDDELLGIYARDLPDGVDVKKLKQRIAQYNKDFGYDKKVEEYSLPKNIVKQLNDYDKQVVKLSDELNSCTQEYSNLQAIHDTLNADYAALMRERNDFAEKINALNEQVSAAEEVATCYASTKSTDDNLIERLQEEKKDLEDKVVALNTTIDEDAKFIAKLKLSCRNSIERLVTKNEELEAALEAKPKVTNKRKKVSERKPANERHEIAERRPANERHEISRLDDPQVSSVETLKLKFGLVAKGTVEHLREFIYGTVPENPGICQFNLLEQTSSYNLTGNLKKLFVEYLKTRQDLFEVKNDVVYSKVDRAVILKDVLEEID